RRRMLTMPKTKQSSLSSFPKFGRNCLRKKSKPLNQRSKRGILWSLAENREGCFESKRPNKSPEPTPPTGTSRAFEPKLKSPNRTDQTFVARAAPVGVVAHL